jgi:UPF0755 protein
MSFAEKRESFEDVFSGKYEDISSGRDDEEDLNRSFENNFRLDIQEEPMGVEYSTQVPAYKGEIYFSARRPTNKTPSAPAKEASAPMAGTKMRWKIGKDISRGGRVLLVSLACILAVSFSVSAYAISCLDEILVFRSGNGDPVVTVEIPPNATTKDVLRILRENGLIRHVLVSDMFVRLTAYMMAYEDEDTGEKIIEEPVYVNGLYDLSASMGVEGMLNTIKEDQSLSETVSLSFPEGWTVDQIIEKLEKYEVCKASLLKTALKTTEFDYPFMEEVNKKAENRYNRFEGYLFPDTYDFFIGETASSVLRKFLENANNKWTKEHGEQAKKLGYTQDQILTIASIIQREAANTRQMPLISSVIHNRLKDKKNNYPSLQCDSTSDFVKNVIKPNVSYSEQMTYRDLYDTYYCIGLPAGPICNPGQDAIDAALNPENTKYFYFRHDKQGNIYMAETVRGHEENLAEILREEG